EKIVDLEEYKVEIHSSVRMYISLRDYTIKTVIGPERELFPLLQTYLHFQGIDETLTYAIHLLHQFDPTVYSESNTHQCFSITGYNQMKRYDEYNANLE